MATPQKLFQDVSAGKFKPAYYFFGSEDYRIVEAEKFVARQFLPDRQLATNYRKIDGKKTSCADLLAELSSLPLLGERQVFAVTSFQSYSPTETERILRLLTPPQLDRVVIFSSPSSRTPKKNSSFFTAVAKVAEPVEFRRLSQREVESRIRANLQKDGIQVEPQAATLLAELVAGNRGALEMETSKLVNYKQTGETVSVEDVRQIAAGYEVFNIFQVADVIVAGNTRKVLQMIESLLAAGNSAATVISLMLQHFISLYLVKNHKKPLGRRGFLIGKFTEQAVKYDNSRLEQIIIDIADAEAQLRRGGFKPAMALEVLALTLTGETGGAK